MNICHGDIKLENIVYKDNTDDFLLIDMGFSEEIPKDEYSYNEFGTIWYLPPEAFTSQGHNLKADVYSLGVVLFACLVGEMPFEARTVQEYIYNQKTKSPAFELLHQHNVSDAVEILIMSMMEPNIEDRFSIEQCIEFLYSDDLDC